ncbi:hypothetical protein TorRG33x02_064860 [Trema orientale]|uniref:Uncharacterized protein n=1 Tax=Trema orientale TaxID=63057 RepID=A0A2P5FII0_TREOI|nr:hypothetical protein TorRG33x02_064860 [Trema orientale]
MSKKHSSSCSSSSKKHSYFSLKYSRYSPVTCHEFGPSTSSLLGDHRHQRSISTFAITSHHHHRHHDDQYYPLECAERKITINSGTPCLGRFLWNVPRCRRTWPDNRAGRDRDDCEVEREDEKNLTSHSSNYYTIVVVIDDDNDNDKEWEGDIEIERERKRKRKRKTTSKKHLSSYSSSFKKHSYFSLTYIRYSRVSDSVFI